MQIELVNANKCLQPTTLTFQYARKQMVPSNTQGTLADNCLSPCGSENQLQKPHLVQNQMLAPFQINSPHSVPNMVTSGVNKEQGASLKSGKEGQFL